MTNPSEVLPIKESGDVRAERVARVYADSLYAAADKAGAVDVVLSELESLIRDVFEADSRLEVMLSSAALGRDARASVIEKAFKDRASPTFFAFLQVLNRHERLELLRPIARLMRAINEEKARRVRAIVTSAVALNSDEQAKIVEVLRAVLNLEPILMPVIDPSILGGVKIRVGDKQYDATVRTRIENLRNQILTSSSHEIQSRRDRFRSTDGD